MQIQDSIIVGDDGFILYRRRNQGRYVEKHVQGQIIRLNNRSVVPYNPYLVGRFNCHINVKICSSVKTIKYLRSKKAPGPDQIPNEVLKLVACEICSHLEQMFNDSPTLGHYPSHFKEFIIVILRKHGGNRDYTSPKSYRPISLLNTIGKIMEAILATRISFMATTHNLLPTTHFGGRRGSCIETAIHNLLEKIYAAWNINEIASLLMMDVSAAYPNTSHQRLLYNLRKRKIDGKVVQWVGSFLSNRHTIVKTNEYTTPKLSIKLGLP